MTRALALLAVWLALPGCAASLATRSWSASLAIGDAQAAAGSTVDLEHVEPGEAGDAQRRAHAARRSAVVNVCDAADVPATAAQGAPISQGAANLASGLGGLAAGLLLP